ncbi:MAG: FAD-binding oxidoreductase [Acidobacteria bacterium]|nr:FAD-binding oxidoreductase [Acidobacteriota bacterium]
MPTRYGVSPWLHLSPPARIPPFPGYRGARTADVVVIGGGLTGCAAAYVCAHAGLTTILLEQDRIGQARTAHGMGLLTPEPGPSFRDVVAAHGLRAARRVFEAWRRGALEGVALLRRLRVPCGLDPRDTIVAVRRDGERLLRREYDARRKAGLEAVWLTERQVQARMRVDASGALKVGGGFALDPYRACLGIVAAAAARGAACFERSHVRKVRFTRRHADVVADGGTIRTRKVIVATASATAEFKALQRHFTEREAYVVLTGRMPAVMRKQIGDPHAVLTDRHAPPHHVRWSGDDRLIIAGGDQNETPERKRPAVLLQRTNELMYDLLKMYPAIYGLQPEYGWMTPYGQTADGLMYIGAHRNFPHHLFALGDRAVSATGAFVASRILLRAVQEMPEAADEVFGWNR